MKLKKVFLYLEIKKLISKLPFIIAGAIALSLVIGAVAFCAERMVCDSDFSTDAKIDYVQDDDNLLTNFVVSALTNSEGIKKVCTLNPTDYNTALKDVKNNKVFSSIVVPSGFMDSLSSGENYSINIYFSPKMTMYSVVLYEISKASENLLKSAQAGIYSLYDYYEENNLSEHQDSANEKLNAIYLSQVLDRESTFNKTIISVTGSLSLKDYYLCAGIVLFLLMLGIPLTAYIFTITPNLKSKLNLSGISSDFIILSQNISISFLYVILISIITVILLMLGVNISISSLISILFIACCCSSIIVFLCNVASSNNSAILLVFIITIASSFCSGFFFPHIFLPDVIEKISVFLPTTYIHEALGNIITNKMEFRNILVLIIFSTSFILLSLLIERFKNRGH